MNPIEHLISLLAPHQCLICKKEGSLLCQPCSFTALARSKPSCFKCMASSPSNKTCSSCLTITPILQVWSAALYTGTAQDLVKQLKFQRAKAAATTIATAIHQCLPRMPPDALVCPIPTANSRIRTRGYDQACLVAKHIAKLQNLKYAEPLLRISTTRQVGSSRQERFSQLELAFKVRKPSVIYGKDILIIDDVLTTGATLESAANTLNLYKPRSIKAAVFARA